MKPILINGEPSETGKLPKYTAIVELRHDPERAVVVEADDIIWIAPEFVDQARRTDRNRIPGEVVIDGELITMGVEGEGLGRLTYRLVGEHHEFGQFKVHVAQLEDA